MTRDDVQAWVEGTRPTDWYGKCAGLTDRVVAAFTGADRQWYDSATDARAASGGLNPDPTACPPGGIHFWSYYGTAWDGSYGNWGHVTIDIDGGGTATLSATGAAHEYWGVHAGLISVAAQTARAGMRYLGWARTYGAAKPLNFEASSGGDAAPFTPREWDDMASKEDIAAVVREAIGIPTVRIVTELNGTTQQLVGPLRKIHLEQGHFDLLVRYRDGQPLLEPEMSMVSALLSMVTSDYTDDKLTQIQAQISDLTKQISDGGPQATS